MGVLWTTPHYSRDLHWTSLDTLDTHWIVQIEHENSTSKTMVKFYPYLGIQISYLLRYGDGGNSTAQPMRRTEPVNGSGSTSHQRCHVRKVERAIQNRAAAARSSHHNLGGSDGRRIQRRTARNSDPRLDFYGEDGDTAMR